MLHAGLRHLNTPEAVNFWTDFTQVPLSTKAVFSLPGIWHGSTSFGGFAQGMGILTLEDREDILDRARLLGEACDSPQGLQMFVDDMTGFGGLAAEVLPDLKDAIGIQNVLMFALRATRDAPARSVQQGTAEALWQLNEAFNTACLSSETSVFTPLAAPVYPSNQLEVADISRSHFHSSALCAAALDNVTFPLRASSPPSTLSAGTLTMAQLMQLLAVRPSANLAAISGRMPAPNIPQQVASFDQETDLRMQASPGQIQQSPCMSLWTPGLQLPPHSILSEVTTLRGATCNGISASRPAAEQYLQQLYMTEGSRCRRHTCISTLELQIPLPFPAIFKQHSAEQAAAVGNLVEGPQQAGATLKKLRSCSMMSRWAASRSFEPYVDGILRNFQGACAGSAGRTLIRSWQCDDETVADVKERLAEMMVSYNDL